MTAKVLLDAPEHWHEEPANVRNKVSSFVRSRDEDLSRVVADAAAGLTIGRVPDLDRVRRIRKGCLHHQAGKRHYLSRAGVVRHVNNGTQLRSSTTLEH